jgi:hypothetical protein
MKTLIRNPRLRRRISFGLIVLGGLLIFLAPEGLLFGWVIILLGIAVEILGIRLGHSQNDTV